MLCEQETRRSTKLITDLSSSNIAVTVTMVLIGMESNYFRRGSHLDE